MGSDTRSRCNISLTTETRGLKDNDIAIHPGKPERNGSGRWMPVWFRLVLEFYRLRYTACKQKTVVL